MINKVDSEEYKEYRKSINERISISDIQKVEHKFPTKYDIDSLKMDNAYEYFKDITLTVESYSNGVGHWDYTKGILRNGDIVIAEVVRNYSSFPFKLFKHINGNRYMVCGEDYQGYTLVNIETGEIKSYVSGTLGAMCLVNFDDYDNTHLYVEGCPWGGDFYDIIYDVSDIENLPWTVLSTINQNFEDYDNDDGDDEE